MHFLQINLSMLQNFLNRVPSNITNDNYRFFLFAKKTLLLVSLGHILFLVVTSIAGNKGIILLSIAAIFMDVFALLLLLKGRTNFSLLLIFTYITLFTTFLIYTYGLGLSFSLYVLALIAFVFITPWNLINKVAYSLATIIVFLVVTVYVINNPVPVVDKFTVLVFNIANMFFCGVSIALFIQYYDRKTRQTQEDLTAMHKAKERLYSIIAHDLRGPIGAIAGIAGIVHNDIKSNKVDQETKKLSKIILKTSSESQELLENLLSWAHNNQRDIMPEFSKVDVIALFDNCIELNHAQINQKKISVHYSHDAKHYCKADEKMIFTVLRNLVSNAIKFSTEDGEIGLRVKSLKDSIQYTVYDTGIGMTQDIVSNAFLIDNKKVRPGTNRESGTGLGLVLCRDLVEKNNGKIWIDSAPDMGTQISFELPAYKPKTKRI